MNILKSLFIGSCAFSICFSQGSTQISTIKDIDGNMYQTVKIGDQVWMAENLRTTKLNDGTSIPKVTDGAAWAGLSTPGYCYYGNTVNTDSIRKYGALYNWYAVDKKGLAPKGWHVPTHDDWKILEIHLVGNAYNWDGSKSRNKIAKALASKTDWTISTYAGAIGNDLTENNKSGFSALPGGFRSTSGMFNVQSLLGYWWSASELEASSARVRRLHCDYDFLLPSSEDKSYGISVRLLRDNVRPE